MSQSDALYRAQSLQNTLLHLDEGETTCRHDAIPLVSERSAEVTANIINRSFSLNQKWRPDLSFQVRSGVRLTELFVLLSSAGRSQSRHPLQAAVFTTAVKSSRNLMGAPKVQDGVRYVCPQHCLTPP